MKIIQILVLISFSLFISSCWVSEEKKDIKTTSETNTGVEVKEKKQMVEVENSGSTIIESEKEDILNKELSEESDQTISWKEDIIVEEKNIISEGEKSKENNLEEESSNSENNDSEISEEDQVTAEELFEILNIWVDDIDDTEKTINSTK